MLCSKGAPAPGCAVNGVWSVLLVPFARQAWQAVHASAAGVHMHLDAALLWGTACMAEGWHESSSHQVVRPALL